MKTEPRRTYRCIDGESPAADRRGIDSRPPLIRRAYGVLVAFLAVVAALGGPASLTVNLTPGDAVTAGAGWRFLDESVWRDSGTAYTNVAFGPHFLEFKRVNGWIAPVVDSPVMIEPSTSITMYRSYTILPRNPVYVTATAGGLVREEAWAPNFNGLRPSVSTGSEAALNNEWELDRKGWSRPATMPAENTGWRVRLRAMAFPGYQFVGWTGDTAGTGNPLTLIVGGTRQIQAHFARPLELFAATHLAGHYYSPGTTVLHGQFSLPVDARLQQLTWRPGLPKGWTLRAVSGLGGPRRQGSTVVFEQLVNHNPVQFNLSVEVPAGETDAREIAGNAEFTLAGETASQTQPITPLTLFDESSPAATLALDLAGAHPTLTIRGAVGRTYVIEQTAIEFLPNWAFMGDVTLTNSTQVYLDPFPRLYNGDLIYRASVIE